MNIKKVLSKLNQIWIHIKDFLSNKNSKKEKFDSMIKFAKEIIKSSKQSTSPTFIHPIYDYIKLLGASTRNKYALHLIFAENRLSNIDFESLFFPLCFEVGFDNKQASTLLLDTHKYLTLETDLARDLILPWPWDRSRFLRSFVNIGEERIFGKWTQDSNHIVELLRPVEIVFVQSGNHSINAGILQGSGKLITTSVVDLSNIYEHVKTDGQYYYRLHDGSKICKVTSVEFAAIFEIGRLIIKNGIQRIRI